MRSRVAGRWACVFFIPLSSVMAQEGVFAIQGFSNQQLVWSDGVQTRAFGALGSTANLLRFQGGDLLVVHSGDWSQGGAGAELWRAPLPALMAAQQAGQPLPWQVIDLVDGENPWDVATAGDGSWWVSLLNTGAVVRVDGQGQELARISGLDAPEGLALAQGVLAVAESGWGHGSTVRLFDAATGVELAAAAVGANPQSLALDGEGRLWCLCSGRSWEGVGATLHALDLDGTALGSWPVAGNPAELLLDLSDQSFWLGDEWGAVPLQRGPLDDPAALAALSGVPGGSLASRSGDVLVAGAFSGTLQGRAFDGTLSWEAATLPGGAVDLCAVPDPTTLAAPAQLQIRHQGGFLQLAWSPVLGADGYRVEQAGPGASWLPVALTKAPRLDLGLAPAAGLGTFRVRALGAW